MWRARWDTGGTHTFERRSRDQPPTLKSRVRRWRPRGNQQRPPLSRSRGREPGKLTPRGGRWETLVLKLAESLRSRLATPHETQSTYGRPASPWNTGAKSRADPPRRFPGLTPLYIRYAQALDASTTLRTHAHRDRDHSGRGASQRQESSPHTAVRATDCLPNTKELSHRRLDWIPREESRFQAEDSTSNRVRIGRELREPEQFP